MFRHPATPFALLGLVLGIGLCAGLLALWAALAQPWLGLRLAAEGDAVAVVSVAPGGPAARAGIRAGDRLEGLRAADGTFLPVAPGDLVEDPDMLPDFATLDRFMARQGRLSAALREGAALFVSPGVSGGGAEVRAEPRRPLSSLPAGFWVQWGVALVGVWIGGWVWALRRRDVAAGMLLLPGAGLLASALAAAIYSSRELALPQGLFLLLSELNLLGALVFGMGLIGLFLSYPVRLARPVRIWLPVAVLGLWWLATLLRVVPTMAAGYQLSIVAALAAIAVLIALQYRATRNDPLARAALRWFGLSVLIGAGAFVITIVVPLLLGFEAALAQSFAFLFFLVIYVGIALGVTRYRLFDLERWAFNILFYMGGVVLLLLLDAALIVLVALDRVPAFGIALIAVALVYLPVRDGLARRLLRRDSAGGAGFRDVSDVALTPPHGSRQARWEALLQTEFAPLRIEPVAAPGPAAPALAEEGAALEIPGTDGLAPLRLRWPRGGRGLFSPRDAARAGELVTMLAEIGASRRAYETGVAEERSRIAQDMHDNIGIQLMGALHSPSSERKDVLIRETLADLRDILSNATGGDLDLGALLSDLRAGLADHAAATGHRLDWRMEIPDEVTAPPRLAHALRSILREAVGNALRHAGASVVRVRVVAEGARITFEIEDDGKGIPPDRLEAGNGGMGLTTMRARATGQGGEVTFGAAQGFAQGTRVAGWLPAQGPAQGPVPAEAPGGPKAGMRGVA